MLYKRSPIGLYTIHSCEPCNAVKLYFEEKQSLKKEPSSRILRICRAYKAAIGMCKML